MRTDVDERTRGEVDAVAGVRTGRGGGGGRGVASPRAELRRVNVHEHLLAVGAHDDDKEVAAPPSPAPVQQQSR
jgi:hypothetical protein